MRFRIADAFLPGADELRAILRDAESLEGSVIDFSDSGTKANAFAIVEIVQRRTVVPVEKLELTDDVEANARFRPEA